MAAVAPDGAALAVGAAGICDPADVGAITAAAVAVSARVGGGAAAVEAVPAGIDWLPQAAKKTSANTAQQRSMIRLNIGVPFDQ